MPKEAAALVRQRSHVADWLTRAMKRSRQADGTPWNDRALATKAGISRGTIWRIKSRTCDATPRIIVHLEEALGVTLNAGGQSVQDRIAKMFEDIIAQEELLKTPAGRALLRKLITDFGSSLSKMGHKDAACRVLETLTQLEQRDDA